MEMDQAMKVSKKQLYELGAILAFKCVLELVYVFFVNPMFAYTGFTIQPSIVKFLESYLLALVLFFCLPKGERKLSAVATKILYIFMVIPTLSLYFLNDESRRFLYLFMTGFWLTLLTVRILPRFRVRRLRNSNYVMFIVLSVISVVVCALLIYFNGLPTLRALNFSSVYDIRRSVDYGPSVMRYLVNWQANVINCFLIGVAWYRRRYGLLLISLGLQFVLFLTTGHKSYLFIPFFVFLVLYAIQKQSLMKILLLGLIAVIFLSFMIYIFGWSVTPASFLIRRVFFVPSKIYFYYYDFFSQNDLVLLSQSRLGFFLDSPYDISTANMMGMLYAGKAETHMNAGYLADAYMNFGALGVLFFSVLVGVIFSLLDSVTAKIDIVISASALVVPIRNLYGGALLTTLITHGLLFGVLLTWLYARKMYPKKGVGSVR